MNKCPLCGKENALRVLVDAWAIYEFKGYDDRGYPIKGDERAATEEFDDEHVECGECGETVSWFDMPEKKEEEK